MYFRWKAAILIPYVIYDYQITSDLEKVKLEGFIKLFLNISCGQIFADYLSFYFSLGRIFADLAKIYELRENESPRKLISWRQLFCLNQWVWWNLILNTSQRKKILLFSKNFCSWLNFWHSSCWSTLFFSDVRYHKKNSLLFIFTPISFRSRFIKSVSGSFHLS